MGLQDTIVRAKRPREDLTPRQAEVLEFIEARISAGLPFPSIRAITDYISARDPGSADGALLALAEYGWIRHAGWETTGRRQRIWKLATAPDLPAPTPVQQPAPAPHNGAGWNDARVALLKKLWAAGLSASLCAVQLGGGISRNAVISKVHRLGLALRGNTKPKVARSTRPRQPRVSLRQSRPMPAWKQAWLASQASVEPLPPEPIIPAHRRKPILVRKGGVLHANENLTESCCRWPAGDPQDADFGFCGKQKITGLPYCEAHARRAYQAAQPRVRRPRDAPLSMVVTAQLKNERELV